LVIGEWYFQYLTRYRPEKLSRSDRRQAAAGAQIHPDRYHCPV